MGFHRRQGYGGPAGSKVNVLNVQHRTSNLNFQEGILPVSYFTNSNSPVPISR
jgi:hypothetical protein